MEEIGVPVQGALTGDEIAKLTDEELRHVADGITIFSRVTPEQKQRIIRALRENGHVVAYMGDGVNDVLSLKEADVSISVQNAVDVAKQTADIILLKKGLHEITKGSSRAGKRSPTRSNISRWRFHPTSATCSACRSRRSFCRSCP